MQRIVGSIWLQSQRVLEDLSLTSVKAKLARTLKFTAGTNGCGVNRLLLLFGEQFQVSR